MRPIILGSSSSTRAALLEKFGIPFVQKGCDFDEEALRISDPVGFVYHATKGKMASCLRAHALEGGILCADTVVVAHGKILRKAKDKADARAILEAQSGTQVSIITCMIYKTHTRELTDMAATHYRFRPFDAEALERYLEGDEWVGKAGACMVEGFCKAYIEEVIGLESTAMGLCVEHLLPFLEV